MRKIIDLLITFCLLLNCSNRISAQEMIAPIDIPLRVSGNFGELRNDHFHSGLDFTTQGVTGHPVKSVKAGFVSRISVGPYGYGRAIYVTHPDGTTSVYGHLDRFAWEIEAAVKDNQYEKESFTVNLYFSANDFPVRQGEIIAYSGNTGGSSGPHLHFELRNTETEKPIDPIPALRSKLKDSRPPEIQSLMFFPQQGKGVVNGSSSKQINKVIKDKQGRYILSQPVKAWGAIGIGIKAYDRMDATASILGVKEIQLKVNNTIVYHSVMDGFYFYETRYLNSFIDWEDWIMRKSFFMKSFLEPGNKLGIYRSNTPGLIFIHESKTYTCEYMLRDAHGNTSSFVFTIIGQSQAIPEERKTGILFSYDKNNEYKGKDMELNIPKGNLYTDIYLNPDILDTGYSDYAPLYSFGRRMPLHSYSQLTLTVTNDSYPDKSKYGVISIVNNKPVWLGGEYEWRKIKVRVRELGQFTVVVDSVPPTVVPLNQDKWAINKRIAFRITDEMSDISFYQGRLDGKFVLFEYDAKNNLLFCNFDPNRMKQGRQTLTLMVRDGAKNVTRVNYEVMF